MADGGSGEKTEEPTPERLRKLRNDGNVPKSQDVNSAVSFLVVFVVLAGTMPFIAKQMTELTRFTMHIAVYHTVLTTEIIAAVLAEAMWTMFRVTGPVLATAFVLGLVLNVAQVGFLFSTKPITPDLNKVNPINGFKNLFNMKKIVELLKTLIKFIVVSYVSYQAIKKALRDVTLIARSDIFIAVKIIGSIIWDFVTKIGMVLYCNRGFRRFLSAPSGTSKTIR